LNEVKVKKDNKSIELSEKDFEVLFGKVAYVDNELKRKSKGFSAKLAQKCYHMYNVPKDTTENYVSEIVAKEKGTIKELLDLDKGKAYNYIFDRLRSQDYLYVRRLKTKNANEFKYKVYVNVKVKKSTDKYNLLNDIIEEISHFFDIESKNIYDINTKEDEIINKDFFFDIKNDEIIYKVMFYGKPTKAFIYTEELEQEIEKSINNQVNLNIDFCKVQDIDIKVIKNFRKSMFYDIESVDFSDDTIDITDKKTLYYAYIDEFNLRDCEEAFINLSFQGYNVYKEEDIPYFKEVLKKKDNQEFSKNYLRTKFLNKLCDKLSDNSPFS